MYHLTRYKYWFFGISLAVILPGLLALAIWGLNLGIDFTGGSTVDLSFAANNVTTAQVQHVFEQAGAKDVRVFSATNLNGGVAPNHTIYITLNHEIDKSEVSTILTRLGDSKAKLPKNPTLLGENLLLQQPGSKSTQAVVVVQFDGAITSTDAVKNALQNLPQTGPAPVANNGQTQAAATPSATPAATPSASNGTSGSAQTSPVSVAAVQTGTSNQIYQVETQTSFNTGEVKSKGYVDVNVILATLNGKYGGVYAQSQNNIDAAVGAQTTVYAVLAVLAASIAIMLYIGYAFRHVGSIPLAFRFGASAVIALLHDALVVLGLWAIFGHFFDFKVDSLFLTAVLTVIGFSVHDTIVVFDRIRENLRRRTSETFETVVNASLVQTMSRSLNTSLTVLLTLAALTLFGGESTQQFTLALLIGIMSGTYSSIFNASMILSVWETREYRTWFRRQPKARPATTSPRRALAETRA